MQAWVLNFHASGTFLCGSYICGKVAAFQRTLQYTSFTLWSIISVKIRAGHDEVVRGRSAIL